jgi:hypothetical protein
MNLQPGGRNRQLEPARAGAPRIYKAANLLNQPIVMLK